MTTAANVDASRLVKRLARLGDRSIPNAVSSALNRAGKGVRTDVVKDLTSRLTLRSKTARDAIRVFNPTRDQVRRGDAWVDLRASGGPLPLEEFSASMTAKGVTYRISKRGGRSVYRAGGRAAFQVGRSGSSTSASGRRRRTFTANSKYGSRVYVTRGAGRSQGTWLRISGPGIAQLVAGRRMRRVMQKSFDRRFPKEFNSALKSRLSRLEG